jgi:hypothetical protein
MKTKDEIVQEMTKLEEEQSLLNFRVTSLKSMIARYVEREEKKNETRKRKC